MFSRRVLRRSAFTGVYLRDTAAPASGQSTLTILGASSGYEAVESFQKNYPQVSIKLPNDRYFELRDVATKILTGDDSADLYLLDTARGDFNTLKEKGFALDVSDSTVLLTSVHKMYPQIQTALMTGDQLVAFPARLTLSTPLGYEAKAFEALGLEVPLTWGDVMGLWVRWNEELRIAGAFLIDSLAYIKFFK